MSILSIAPDISIKAKSKLAINKSGLCVVSIKIIIKLKKIVRTTSGINIKFRNWDIHSVSNLCILSRIQIGGCYCDDRLANIRRLLDSNLVALFIKFRSIVIFIQYINCQCCSSIIISTFYL